MITWVISLAIGKKKMSTILIERNFKHSVTSKKMT